MILMVKKIIKIFGLHGFLVKLKRKFIDWRSDRKLRRKLKEHKRLNNPFNVNSPGVRELYLDQIERLKNGHNAEFVERIFQYTKFHADQEFLFRLGSLTKAGLNKGISAPSYDLGYILYGVTRKFIKDNDSERQFNIMEVGTSHGFSSTVLAKALYEASVLGKVITIDILPSKNSIYWNTIADLDGPQSRYDVLKDFKSLIDTYLIYIQGNSDYLLKTLFLPRIHIAFIDGGHLRREVVHDFLNIIPYQKAGDLLLADDYNENHPAVQEIVDLIVDIGLYTKEVVFDTLGQKGVSLSVGILKRTDKTCFLDELNFGDLKLESYKKFFFPL